GRAQAAGALTLHAPQLRRHAINKHGQVDDAPYGGEAGMVLRPEPLQAALQEVLAPGTDANHAKDMGGGGETTGSAPGAKPHVVYMSAQGALLTQRRAVELAALPRLVVVCGHYKGVDQRFLDAHVDEEISLGDYVLSGGELPAMVLIDAVARLLPGVLGDIDSADTDSHALPGRLGWPVYTRPQEFEGRGVPEVLLSGHHARIEDWRTLESLRLTRARRPDLLERHPLTARERDLVDPPPKKRRRGRPPAASGAGGEGTGPGSAPGRPVDSKTPPAS